jgi:hypothetical protein
VEEAVSRFRRVATITLVLGAGSMVLTACLPPAPPPPPPTVTCSNAGTAGASVANCHIVYAYYQVDPNPFAQQVADLIAASGATCANLEARHTSSGALFNAYPSAFSVGENLYCQGGCPSNAQGATNALNAWLASPPHRANMDTFVGAFVVGGAACNGGSTSRSRTTTARRPAPAPARPSTGSGHQRC